jgi:hypothetical protein
VAGEVAVTPGTTYTGLVAFMPVTVEREARALLRWFDDDGVLVASGTGELVNEIDGEWVLAVVVAEAPAGAASALVAGEVTDVDAGEQHHIDTFGVVDYETDEWEPGDPPTVVFNRVHRRLAGDTGSGLRLADPTTGDPVQVVPNGSWTDWFVEPTTNERPRVYEYRLEAVSDTGTTRFGAWTT